MSGQVKRAFNVTRIKGSFLGLPASTERKPFDLLPRKLKDPQKLALFNLMKDFSLRGIQRIDFSFDPFSSQSVSSIRFVIFIDHDITVSFTTISLHRNVSFHVSAERIRLTNTGCSLRTSVLTDRSEPSIRVVFDNNKKTIVYKTSNLTELEILRHLKDVVDAESPPIPTVQAKK